MIGEEGKKMDDNLRDAACGILWDMVSNLSHKGDEEEADAIVTSAADKILALAAPSPGSAAPAALVKFTNDDEALEAIENMYIVSEALEDAKKRVEWVTEFIRDAGKAGKFMPTPPPAAATGQPQAQERPESLWDNLNQMVWRVRKEWEGYRGDATTLGYLGRAMDELRDAHVAVLMAPKQGGEA